MGESLIISFLEFPLFPQMLDKTCLHSNPLAAETVHSLSPNAQQRTSKKNKTKLRQAPWASLRSLCLSAFLVLLSDKSSGSFSYCTGQIQDAGRRSRQKGSLACFSITPSYVTKLVTESFQLSTQLSRPRSLCLGEISGY